MGHGITTVELRRQRKTLTLRGLGKTARGQKYIKVSIPLDVTSFADESLKGEIARVVNEMLV